MAATMQSSKGGDQLVERQSICFPGVPAGVAIHAGEADFTVNLEKHFVPAENNAAENLVALKAELRTLDTEAFWTRLMEGLAKLCHAQFGFVSKRILVDDHDSAVEMPPIGEAGSCLMGVALYWNNGKDIKNMSRDYKYYAWGAPCSYMRHDKVFLVADELGKYVTDNPNQLPFECEGYLGVPLFAEGKCFAHFGLMWTKEGLEFKSGLSWGYIEMVMHSLEDMIAERLLSGQGIAKVNGGVNSHDAAEVPPRVIPQEMVTPAQSLKPYAKSLSHELRTPMHGVVGMLDIMYATVQEQIEEQSSSKILDVFKMLKDNIEMVQDSSKRAVEAADNVVYAYDLNMQIPETPSQPTTGSLESEQEYFDIRPGATEADDIVHSAKRKRSEGNTWHNGNPTKLRQMSKQVRWNGSETPQLPAPWSEMAKPLSPESSKPAEWSDQEPQKFEFSRPAWMTATDPEAISNSGSRQCNIRDLIPVVIQEALRVGGRPESAITEPLSFGERIVVRTQSSNGHSSSKTIQWSVEEEVPELVAMDERDLSKLISSVFLNAVKFTEDGDITVHIRLDSNKQYVLIAIADTGSGIPKTFQSELFKPFAKGDHSITRNKEGLGLGLLVAKGLARRSGGDLLLLRSSMGGPDQGTEFEIRIPLDHMDRSSRTATPFGNTPTPTPDRILPRDITNTPAAALDQQIIDERPSTPVPRPLSPPRTTTPRVPAHEKRPTEAAASDERPNIPRRLSRVPAATSSANETWDKNLAQKYPLKFLVAEDNKINRRLLVTMLKKLGYGTVYEAFDGREAVRLTRTLLEECARDLLYNGKHSSVDVILMDLWMPEMDGYEATETIMAMYDGGSLGPAPVVLAVSADVTDQAVKRAAKIGMRGYMTKPYKLIDLQRLIVEFCGSRAHT